MPRSKDSSRPKKIPAPTKTTLRAERAKIAVPHPGLRFGHKHHVFIAKLKRGEVWAPNHLKLETKVAVTPLLEMWPPNPATPTKPSKSLTAHTTSLMETLANEWTGLPCYIDTKYLVAGAAPSPANAQTVFNIARTLKINAVPVTSPFFSEAFQQIIRNVISTDKRGVMFRLPLRFFNDAQQIARYLDGLAAALGVTRNKVDILIDLECRPNGLASLLREHVRNANAERLFATGCSQAYKAHHLSAVDRPRVKLLRLVSERKRMRQITRGR